MDSVTQITLGAAVGEAVLGRRLGNRAIFWGAVFGTVPDLDAVLTPLFDPVQFIVYHRNLSHSLLAVGVLSPVLAWGFRRWYGEVVSAWRWFWFFFLVLLTHILLDCCTNYGTQIFMPFSDRRVAWNNIFVIDPLYTGPFLVCVILCWFLNRENPWRWRINAIGLILSTSYLAMTFVVQQHVKTVFAKSLAEQNIEFERLLVCPTPLNTVLWYGIAEEQDSYRIGFYSLKDAKTEIRFLSVPQRAELLGDLKTEYGVDRLLWFADGYYCVRPHGDDLVLHILKLGKLNLMEDAELYPFSYIIHRKNSTVEIERDHTPERAAVTELIAGLWKRLQGQKDTPL